MDNFRLSKRFIRDFKKSLSEVDSVQLVKFYTFLQDIYKFTYENWGLYKEIGSISIKLSILFCDFRYALCSLYFEELKKRGLMKPRLTGTELAEYCCNCLSVENPSGFLDSFFGSFKNGRQDLDVHTDLNSKEIL